MTLARSLADAHLPVCKSHSVTAFHLMRASLSPPRCLEPPPTAPPQRLSTFSPYWDTIRLRYTQKSAFRFKNNVNGTGVMNNMSALSGRNKATHAISFIWSDGEDISTKWRWDREETWFCRKQLIKRLKFVSHDKFFTVTQKRHDLTSLSAPAIPPTLWNTTFSSSAAVKTFNITHCCRDSWEVVLWGDKSSWRNCTFCYSQQGLYCIIVTGF